MSELAAAVRDVVRNDDKLGAEMVRGRVTDDDRGTCIDHNDAVQPAIGGVFGNVRRTHPVRQFRASGRHGRARTGPNGQLRLN